MLSGHIETLKFKISLNQHEHDSTDKDTPSLYLYIKKELTRKVATSTFPYCTGSPREIE